MKQSIKLKIFCAVALFATSIFIYSCSKDSVGDGTDSPSRLELYLTDSPADYQEVWIDIQDVKVKTPGDNSEDEGSWNSVSLVRPGMYNLLEFRNGTDTILGGVDLPAGTVSQIRLILGENNYVVLKDGTSIPLQTPSAQESGLKLKVNADLKPGIPYALVLDFDAARSIVEAGNSGKYLLKPVIRTFAREAGGAIEGKVLPAEAHVSVWAYTETPDGRDTLAAIPNDDGFYKFWGIAAGTYELKFEADPETDYQDSILDDILVEKGKVTTIEPVELIKE